jgi:hypothetical protein
LESLAIHCSIAVCGLRFLSAFLKRNTVRTTAKTKGEATAHHGNGGLKKSTISAKHAPAMRKIDHVILIATELFNIAVVR